MGMPKLDNDENSLEKQTIVNIEHINIYLTIARRKFIPKLTEAYNFANRLETQTRNSHRKKISKIFEELESINANLWIRFFKGALRDKLQEQSDKFGKLKEKYDEEISVENFQNVKEETIKIIKETKGDVDSLIEFLEFEKNIYQKEIIERGQHLKRIK